MLNKEETLKQIVEACKKNFILADDKEDIETKYLLVCDKEHEGREDMAILIIIGLADELGIYGDWLVDELGITLNKTLNHKKETYDEILRMSKYDIDSWRRFLNKRKLVMNYLKLKYNLKWD